jgi:hypothetical protein
MHDDGRRLEPEDRLGSIAASRGVLEVIKTIPLHFGQACTVFAWRAEHEEYGARRLIGPAIQTA